MSPQTIPASDPGWHGADPLDPANRDDPYPSYRHLREVAPVHRTPMGFWRVARYDDVRDVLRDPRMGVREADGALPPQLFPRQQGGNFMLMQDPPHHTRIRKLVSKAFTPRAIEAMRPRVQSIVDELLDRVRDAGEMDVIDDLAFPLPTVVICEMLGVPASDRERFKTWTADVTHLLAPMFASAETLQRAMAAGEALGEYFEDLIAERRRRPGDDLMSALIRAEEEGDRLSREELVANSIGLLIAGFETTMGLIGNGVRALLEHRDQLDRLRADPRLIETAVEECLRFDSPIQATRRVAHEEIEIGGQVVGKNELIVTLIGSANRDPAHFPDPDRFDIARRDNSHLSFGFGAHVCLGAHLARVEAQAAIGTLARRMPALEHAADELRWGRSLFRVLAHLPVTFRRES